MENYNTTIKSEGVVNVISSPIQIKKKLQVGTNEVHDLFFSKESIALLHSNWNLLPLQYKMRMEDDDEV